MLTEPLQLELVSQFNTETYIVAVLRTENVLEYWFFFACPPKITKWCPTAHTPWA